MVSGNQNLSAPCAHHHLGCHCSQDLSVPRAKNTHSARNINTYTYMLTYAYIYPYFYIFVYLHMWITPGSHGYFQFSISMVHLNLPPLYFYLFSNCKKPFVLSSFTHFFIPHIPQTWSSALLTLHQHHPFTPQPSSGCFLLDSFQPLVCIRLNSDIFSC